MGMSTHVVGIKPPDETWKKMKKIWDSCLEADISPPPEVRNFFGGSPLDDAGVVVEERELRHQYDAIEDYSADMSAGIEVDLTKLPKDIKIIRFYNSW
jgi:hypothetical protein